MRLGKHDGPEGAPAQAGRGREPKWARFGHPLHERHRATGDRPLRVREPSAGRKYGHSTTIACSQNLVAPCSVLAFRATRFPRHRLINPVSRRDLFLRFFNVDLFPNCFFPAQLSANRFRFRIGIVLHHKCYRTDGSPMCCAQPPRVPSAPTAPFSYSVLEMLPSSFVCRRSSTLAAPLPHYRRSC